MSGPIWRTSRFAIDLARPRVMGIVNVTPDSFSEGGADASPAQAIARCEQLLTDGADILDLGGESSRPGALPGVTGGTLPLALTGDGTQSLGGRGGLPDMMSSIWSESIVSHSSSAAAIACILSWLSSMSLRAIAYCSSMMRRMTRSTFRIVSSDIVVVLVTERPRKTSPSFSA